MAKQNGLPLCCPHCHRDLTAPPTNRAELTKAWKASFEAWYQTYPHRAHKGEAYEAWLKLMPALMSELAGRLKFVIDKQRLNQQHEWIKNGVPWNREDHPLPATFLNRLMKDLKYGD